MTEIEKDEIFSSIKEIQKLEVDKIIATHFEVEDVSTIRIGQYTASQFLAHLDKMLVQFKARLRQSDYHLLPITFTSERNRHNDSLNLYLKQLHTYLDQSSFDLAASNLK